MENNESTSGTGIAEVIINDPIPPASDADAQKSIPANADEAADKAETPAQQEVKKQSRFQRRLDAQKTARVAAETEARLLRERIQTLEAKEKPAQADGEPKREDFADYETYLDARTDFRAKQSTADVLKTEREAREGRERQSQQAAGVKKVAEAWSERERTFQAATPDYEAVVLPFTEGELQSFSQAGRMAIVESDVGPALLHHLAKNLDEAERIAELSPLRQVAELGKLEAKVTMPAARKASNAPAPPSRVNGGRSAGHGYSDNMTDAEYKEWRKSNGARWAR